MSETPRALTEKEYSKYYPNVPFEQLKFDVLATSRAAAERVIANLQAEVARLTRDCEQLQGITKFDNIELGYWQKRAEAAEKERDTLRERLVQLCGECPEYARMNTLRERVKELEAHLATLLSDNAKLRDSVDLIRRGVEATERAEEREYRDRLDKAFYSCAHEFDSTDSGIIECIGWCTKSLRFIDEHLAGRGK